MKRKVALIILVILIIICTIVSLTSCHKPFSNILNIESVIKSPDPETINFELIDNNFYGAILVDKNTNVMYYWITVNSGAITPIYNEDGTLKIYKDDN